MRRPVAGLVLCVCAFVCASVVLIGQENWYTSYGDGIKAFNAGDFPTAEKKLLAALNNRNTPKDRGPRVLYYGQIRNEFLPEYYLALTYEKLNRWTDALKYATAAEAFRGGAGVKEPQRLAAVRASAEKGLNPTLNAGNNTGAATGGGNTPVGGAGTIGRSGAAGSGGTTVASTEDSVAVTRRRLDTLVADATRFAAAGQFAQARQSTNDAKALGVDAARVDALAKTIDIQETQAQLTAAVRTRSWASATPLAEKLASLDPNNAVGRTARTDIARGMGEDQAKQFERDGLSAFYRGQYQAALDALNKVGVDVKTPRVVFYQACSTAALGLIQNDKAKLQRAHALYLQARPNENAFTVERKYVSPRIKQVLDATS